MQANQTQGRGFFTAPGRQVTGALLRQRSSSFSDHWSQPRLFYNSLTAVEQQFLINAIRFETSMLSQPIQQNVLVQLNRVSHDIAVRVATALSIEAPEADPTYYHSNTTAGISIFGERLPSIATLVVGVLASTTSADSLAQAAAIKEAFAADNVTVSIVAERLSDGVDVTYSGADAIAFDGLIVAEGAEGLITGSTRSTLFPPGRPAQILTDSYAWAKPVGFVGGAEAALGSGSTEAGPGVYAAATVGEVVEGFRDGLAVFKFTNRFPMDE